jgi:hypothetical protein
MQCTSARQKQLPVWLIVVFLMLPACSSGIQVRSDIDPSADFTQYKTYNFFDPMGIEGGYNSPVYGEHFRDAITREMSNRGYREASEPDVWINVTIRTDDKIKMRSYTTPYMTGAYYGRPGGAQYGSALGVGVGVGSRATEVTEVSVFIDMVDPGEQRMIWQGVAVIDANDKVAKQLRDAIHTSVNLVFNEYPYRVGG